jgi:hypothetical protein
MSYRSDTEATYDRTLLSSVPDPTRAEKQEGYNVDLLEDGRDRRARSPPVPNRQPTDQQPLTDGETPAPVVAVPKEGQVENGGEPAAAKGRWYRTRWGITAIVVVIILIIGGIVGGVVGGTHHSSKKNNAVGISSSNSSPTGNATLGNSSSSPQTGGGDGFSATGTNTSPRLTGTSGGTGATTAAIGQNTANVPQASGSLLRR